MSNYELGVLPLIVPLQIVEGVCGSKVDSME